MSLPPYRPIVHPTPILPARIWTRAEVRAFQKLDAMGRFDEEKASVTRVDLAAAFREGRVVENPDVTAARPEPLGRRTWTPAQVAELYRADARGQYSPEEFTALEADAIAAHADGRLLR